MPKPNWGQSPKDVWLSNPPNILPTMDTEVDSFVAYSTYGKGEQWWSGWKTYTKLWSCLRYGVFLNRNNDYKTFVKNIKTNEIVWRSWEDENPYRHRI